MISPDIVFIGVQVLTFLVVVALSAAVINRTANQLQARRRLGRELADPSMVTVRRASLVKSSGVTNPFLLWVQKSTSPTGSRDGDALRRNLALAGIRHPAAPMLYVLARFGLAIGLPIGFILIQQLSDEPIVGLPLIVWTLALCGLGLIAPKAVVDNRANTRKAQLEEQFPDALDLMVVCVEAGLGLESALLRVSREVHESHPRIAEEFGMVTQELAAGRGRADALRALAERAQVDSVKSFVALLIQTDTLGTSIGQTLRTYSNEMRDHRYLRAEEKAMRVPVLLTVPLVACILPVIITALLLPAILDVIRTLLPALKG